MGAPEFRVGIKVRNNLLLNAIERAGYAPGFKFAAAAGVAYNVVNDLINVAASPLGENGRWRGAVLRLCEFLNCHPADVFGDVHLAALKTRCVELRLSASEAALLGGLRESPDPSTALDDAETRERVGTLLGTLTPREQRVLELRHGIGTDDPLTLEAIADMFNVGKERIRQIEAKAMRKMRNPARARLLADAAILEGAARDAYASNGGAKPADDDDEWTIVRGQKIEAHP